MNYGVIVTHISKYSEFNNLFSSDNKDGFKKGYS